MSNPSVPPQPPNTASTALADDAGLEALREAGQHHRLHVTLLFGQMTVFLAATGGLAVRAANPDTSWRLCLGLAIAGALLSLVFLVHHERMYAHSHQARETAKNAHPAGSELYKDIPLKWWLPIRAGTMARVLYLAAVVTWLVVAGWKGFDHASKTTPSCSDKPRTTASNCRRPPTH